MYEWKFWIGEFVRELANAGPSLRAIVSTRVIYTRWARRAAASLPSIPRYECLPVQDAYGESIGPG